LGAVVIGVARGARRSCGETIRAAAAEPSGSAHPEDADGRIRRVARPDPAIETTLAKKHLKREAMALYDVW
jgi:hypothetical protein